MSISTSMALALRLRHEGLMKFVADRVEARDRHADQKVARFNFAAIIVAQGAHEQNREDEVFAEMTELAHDGMKKFHVCVDRPGKRALSREPTTTEVWSLENKSVEKKKIRLAQRSAGNQDATCCVVAPRRSLVACRDIGKVGGVLNIA